MTSFELKPLFKDLVSKYGPIPRHWGLEIQHLRGLGLGGQFSTDQPPFQ